jgi:isopropylmalate/homocitrate/citramalate synthase
MTIVSTACPDDARAEPESLGHDFGAMDVTLCDVGPRDGLQNDEAVLEPAVRAELCERLAATGLPRVEAASFVHPKLVPQMAGAEEVLAALPPSDTTWAALVLNRKGFDRAVAAGTQEIHVAYPVTETFSRRNQNMGVDEAATAAAEIVDAAHDAGLRVTVTLGASFGCPFEGAVDPGVVADHAQRMSAADEVLLADTIGVGVPGQVKRLLEAVDMPVGLHLHNTRNTGYANAYAGLEQGVTLFDASVGGLGGCPFAPRATGNIATEDLLYLLENEGVDTGVDLDGMIRVAEWLSGVLGRPLPGLVHRADGG